MGKILLIGSLALALSACSGASYERKVDGSVIAQNGTVTLQYGPDGKTITGETFVPLDQTSWFSKAFSGITGALTPAQAQLLQLLQGAATSK